MYNRQKREIKREHQKNKRQKEVEIQIRRETVICK